MTNNCISISEVTIECLTCLSVDKHHRAKPSGLPDPVDCHGMKEVIMHRSSYDGTFSDNLWNVFKRYSSDVDVNFATRSTEEV